MEPIDPHNAHEFVGGTCTFSENGILLVGTITRMEYLIGIGIGVLSFTLHQVCDVANGTQMHDSEEMTLSLFFADITLRDGTSEVVITEFTKTAPYGPVWVFQRPSAVG